MKQLILNITTDRETYKRPYIYDLFELSLEYITLDGLQDAKRASDIEDKILEILEAQTV